MTRAISGSSSTTRIFFIMITGPVPRTRRGRVPTPRTPQTAAVTLPSLDRGSGRAARSVRVLTLPGLRRRRRRHRSARATSRIGRASHRCPVLGRRRGRWWSRGEPILCGAITRNRGPSRGRWWRGRRWVLSTASRFVRLPVPLLEERTWPAEDRATPLLGRGCSRRLGWIIAHAIALHASPTIVTTVREGTIWTTEAIECALPPGDVADAPENHQPPREVGSVVVTAQTG